MRFNTIFDNFVLAFGPPRTIVFARQHIAGVVKASQSKSPKRLMFSCAKSRASYRDSGSATAWKDREETITWWHKHSARRGLPSGAGGRPRLVARAAMERHLSRNTPGRPVSKTATAAL